MAENSNWMALSFSSRVIEIPQLESPSKTSDSQNSQFSQPKPKISGQLNPWDRMLEEQIFKIRKFGGRIEKSDIKIKDVEAHYDYEDSFIDDGTPFKKRDAEIIFASEEDYMVIPGDVKELLKTGVYQERFEIINGISHEEYQLGKKRKRNCKNK